MGKQAQEKKEFERLAKEFFESKSYEAELVGGKLADVVAWHPETREFAIVEVKGPREYDALIHFPSEKSYFDLGGKTREQVWEFIKQQDFAIECPGIARLVAFTVSSQLHTYWLKAHEHIEKFQKKTRKSISPSGVTAFLVSPAQRKRITTAVLEFFAQVRMIEQFSIEDAKEICVIQIRYPAYSSRHSSAFGGELPNNSPSP